jgi:hypothetical protein
MRAERKAGIAGLKRLILRLLRQRELPLLIQFTQNRITPSYPSQSRSDQSRHGQIGARDSGQNRQKFHHFSALRDC